MTVSVSFLLAVTLWFIVTLSAQSFTADLRYPVKVVNVPNTKELVNNPPKFLVVKVKAPGLELMNEYLSLNRDTILVDYRIYSSGGSYLTRTGFPTFDGVLPARFDPISTQPDTISLLSLAKDSVKVPVEIAFEPNLAPTFRLSEPISIKPESVTVSGPKELLASIRTWKTRQIETPLLKAPTRLMVPLDTLKMLKPEPAFVNLEFQPEPFTEGLTEVKLQVKNLPENTTLKLIPEKVNLRYLVPLTDYATTDPSQVVLAVDYDRISEKSRFLIPEILEKPENLKISVIDPPTVDFLISQNR